MPNRSAQQLSAVAGPVLEATIITADLAASVAAYEDAFGWRTLAEPARVSHAEAAILDAELEGRRCTVVFPPAGSASAGGVRLIEVPGVAALDPLRTHGWSALEVSVRDVESATEKAKAAGWRVLYRPVTLGGGKLPLVAAQLAGPSGEGVYLTQILGPVAGFELPEPVSDVDGIFIVVLGASSLESSRAVLEEKLGAARVSDRELPVRVVNQQYGFPDGTLHRISSLQLRGRTCIEVDQLPAEAASRVPSGGVPAGILSVALAVSADAPAERVSLPDGALLELRPANLS